VAFDSDRDRNLEIYTTNDQFALRRLTANTALDALPSWSPDGRNIVFVTDRYEAGNRDLVVTSSGGGGLFRKLTESPAWDVAPDWGSAPPGTIGRPPSGSPPPAPAASPRSALACAGR
jgi:Tol biopolymer transport system component